MASAELKDQLKSLAQSYEQNGFAVLDNFLTSDQLDSIRNETSRLIKEAPKSDSKVSGDYFRMKGRQFIESGNKVSYFLDGKTENLDISEPQLPEDLGLLMIGHALHSLNPVFNKLASSEPVKEVYRAIGFVEPTIVQSVVIFKHTKHGEPVPAHQDASFLYSEPANCLVGMWIALDDATAENGCLEFIPGSHKGPLATRLVRKQDNTEDSDDLLECTAPPAEHDDSKFVKAPVKRGGLVIFNGLTVHRSGHNKSDKPRWAHSFHAYDQARSVYSDRNWLQSGENKTFLTVKVS